jgi:septum site-determining protein MinC
MNMNRLGQTPALRMKGVGDSLWITIDPTRSKEFLEKELAVLFKPMQHISDSIRVVIDMGDMDGHEDLLLALGNYLKHNFKVSQVTAAPTEKKTPGKHVRRRGMGQAWDKYTSDVLVIAGLVRSGQKVAAKKHLTILGDVNPGGEVVAGGDIIILGSLCGMASAGQPGNTAAIILALDFRPIQVQIGGLVAAGIAPASDGKVEFAHVEEGVIVVDDYIKTNPFKRLPWPQVR